MGESERWPKKQVRMPPQLEKEFDRFLVEKTGLSEAEIIRGLILEAIRTEKRQDQKKSSSA